MISHFLSRPLQLYDDVASKPNQVAGQKKKNDRALIIARAQLRLFLWHISDMFYIYERATSNLYYSATAAACVGARIWGALGFDGDLPNGAGRSIPIPRIVKLGPDVKLNVYLN